jgi:membrane fusion protein, macrolide-specific efflux system
LNKKNTKKIFIGLVLAAVIAGSALYLGRSKGDSTEVIREISPHTGQIQNLISSTGSVLPRNRLEVRPPVAGRIESILVKEGDKVKKGQTLGWLSSTERAALLDAAQGQGEDKLKYWQEVYKAIGLVAPIDAEVIVSTMQPGQTVTMSDAVLVLSDQLIIRAEVDETDIGKIKVGQKAQISLDAYPQTKIKGTVGHIYYESKTINNVTIYDVDIIPEEVPDFFRSGMNANVDFVVEDKEKALLIPQEALITENNDNYVLLKNGNAKDPIVRQVTPGLSQNKFVEIVSGINADDIVVVRSKKYVLPKNASLGKNPFLPSRRPATTGNTTGTRRTGGGPPM